MQGPTACVCAGASGVRNSGGDIAAHVPDRGASAVEYGILIALVAGVIVGILLVLGEQVLDLYTSVIGLF